ncbi:MULTISPECIES: outer membrane beta-barrel protein [unclassified Variovorax]|uniref:outer membrane beta-barrel protein n=1 Tax=unclassified Variovorax TaxID=663243 RepID=UPI00131882B4|nr:MULTISPECIES: outer membrane beta-barrel protein [unclassified Variovorax]VTU42799.1 Outer membrane protein II* [Variovorax sp. PBL-H6]VTU43671.1 Outer membrane protein II* [Variovorax sp. SRS16]VTU43734.1 Outer membrane protein II* [Variovorax sp. PBL-E5]
MKKSLLALALLAAATLGGAAHAAPALDNFYAGAGLDYSHYRLSDKTAFGIKAGDVGATIYGGYQFNPHVAAEIGYARLGDIEQRDGVGFAQNSMLSASVLGFAPSYRGVTAFGRLGIADTASEVEGRRFHRNAPLFGVGAEYKLNATFALRTELQYVPNFGDSRADLYNLSAGIKASF